MIKRLSKFISLNSGMKVFEESMDPKNSGMKRMQCTQHTRAHERCVSDNDERGFWQSEGILQNEIDGEKLCGSR